MTDTIRNTLTATRNATVRLLSSAGIRPNHLTLMGLIISTFAAAAFSFHRLALAALLLIIAGALDVLDGQLARETGQVTRFGAFFDSVVDRYSDAVVFLGITVSYLSSGRAAHALLTMIALVGALITSYSRARGESMLSPAWRDEVGYLKRPERVILLIIGALTRNMDMTIWVLAILSHLTVLQRVFLVRRDIARESSSPPPAVNSAERPAEGGIGAGFKPALPKALSFNLIFWDYPRNSWQFYLLSAIALLLILLL